MIDIQKKFVMRTKQFVHNGSKIPQWDWQEVTAAEEK